MSDNGGSGLRMVNQTIEGWWTGRHRGSSCAAIGQLEATLMSDGKTLKRTHTHGHGSWLVANFKIISVWCSISKANSKRIRGDRERHIAMKQLIDPIFKAFSRVQIVLGILEQKLHVWYQLTNCKLHAWTETWHQMFLDGLLATYRLVRDLRLGLHWSINSKTC